MSSVLLATLGGQPQLITFALDALFNQGEEIQEVIILYLSQDGSRVNEALEKLSLEFVGDNYTHLHKPCRLRAIPLRDGLTRLADIQTKKHAIASFEVLQELMTDLKKQPKPLHLFVAGGRRMMSLLLVSLAHSYFGLEDKLWHIYTPSEFQAQARYGAIMHAQPTDGVNLIQVPLLPLSVQFPVMRQLTTLSDVPKRQPMSKLDRETCQQVQAKLTPRQQEVLKLLARGLVPQDVASELFIKLSTVQTHQTTIFAECQVAWGLTERLDYHFLREKFGPFFE